MENKVEKYVHDEFGELEVMQVGDKFWFPAVECAGILGYTNPRAAVLRHCVGDGVTKRDGVSLTTNQHGVTTEQVVSIKYIDEGNLYRLIIRSKKPEARAFEKWVFDIVLPSIMEYSMYKTFATKYRTSMSKIIQKFRIGKQFGIQFTDNKGRTKTRFFYNEGFARKPLLKSSGVDTLPSTVKYSSKTSLMDRLSAQQCELCGNTDVEFEMHHIRKLKDLKGKSYWERFMIARNRKTLALCIDCHTKLHSGKLN